MSGRLGLGAVCPPGRTHIGMSARGYRHVCAFGGGNGSAYLRGLPGLTNLCQEWTGPGLLIALGAMSQVDW